MAEGAYPGTWEFVRLEKEEGVVTMTFVSPDPGKPVSFKGNALREQSQALQVIDRDPEARVLVVTGEHIPDRERQVFSSGANTDNFYEVAKLIAAGKITDDRDWSRRVFLATKGIKLQQMKIPSIAMVNGDAVGFGLVWALQCDLAIAADTARFMQGYIRMALVPGAGIHDWVYKVGLRRALEMAFTSEFIDAATAERYGLLNKVVPSDQLRDETYRIAKRIAQQAPEAIALTKRLYYAAVDTPSYVMSQIEGITHHDNAHGPEHLEAVSAFTEKRKPVWKDITV